MTLLAENRKINTFNLNTIFGGHLVRYDVVASDIIYAGAFVVEGTAGVKPATGSAVGACLGVAMTKGDNASGSAGDVTVDVLVGGTFVIPAADIVGVTGVIADVGARLFCDDDNVLVTETADADPTEEVFGQVIGLHGTDLIVKHDAPQFAAPTYTILNAVTDRTIDANAAVAVIADGLATLIQDLATQGIVHIA